VRIEVRPQAHDAHKMPDDGHQADGAHNRHGAGGRTPGRGQHGKHDSSDKDSSRQFVGSQERIADLSGQAEKEQRPTRNSMPVPAMNHFTP
jgi:hypothetical protein